MNSETTIEALHTTARLEAKDYDHDYWNQAPPISITRYWSGAVAPRGRHAEARLLYHDEALLARFICQQDEPLVINPAPQTEAKTNALWERDVCEIFIAADPLMPERYLEFEAAPTGEWLDLAVHQMPDARATDWDFHSGMTAAAKIAEREITIAVRIPWEAFRKKSQTGETWRANLFRCVGSAPDRGYLAWQPTFTEQPNFHVPQRFGSLIFK